MVLILETVLRDAMGNQIDATVNTGVAQTGGKLVIETVDDVEISLHRFLDPAFSAAVIGVITLQGTPIADTSANAGVAAQFSIFDRDDLKILEGIVAVAGQDLDLSSLSVDAGDTISLTSFSITVPA